MSVLRKHYVTFLCPGAFVAKDTTRDIASCDVAARVVQTIRGWLWTQPSRVGDVVLKSEGATS